MAKRNTLKPGEELHEGGSLTSANGRYIFQIQEDGNAVVFRPVDLKVIWATMTAGRDPLFAMQGDGNAVLYFGGQPAWASHTNRPGSSLVLTDTGGLLIVEAVPRTTLIAGPDPFPPAPVDPPVPPGPPIPDVPGATGLIRFFGERAVGDDDGAKLYVGLSRFPWLYFWKHDRDRVLRELDADRAAGYRYGRVLAQVGNPADPADFWAGRIVDPDWPDYEEQIASLNRAAAERGHLIGWTMIGKGGPYDRDQASRSRLVDRVARVLATNPVASLFQEIMNEPNVGNTITGGELRDLAFQAKALAPVIPTATGAVWTEAGWTYDQALTRTQFEVDIEHLDRDTTKGEGQDRPWRQGWDHGLTGRRWIDNEPIGPGSSVNREARPDVLRSHRAVNFVCGAFASCLHGKPGVRGDIPWDAEPAYFQAPKAVRFLPGLLPAGRPHNANPKFPGRPFDVPAGFIRAENGNTRGIVRCYTRELAEVFYSIPFGPVSAYELRAVRPLRIACYQQDLGEQLWERDVAAGDVIAFDNPACDYLLVSRPR